MQSAIYNEALQNDLIEFIQQSKGLPIVTFRGMAVILDDNLTKAVAGIYVTIMFGPGAVGSAVAPHALDMERKYGELPQLVMVVVRPLCTVGLT